MIVAKRRFYGGNLSYLWILWISIVPGYFLRQSIRWSIA
ncbi:hypothetical protein LSS_21055 [Leptospira santarosai serovar Shermani str. LT 821]|uniref:Uncharacterized protein n=1 Tax=Leptospira santarosai serovar Shermani str. LT 821 TaxID=758847 RepID=A0A097ESC4_9LEPT|nr:hypothetical protein LSS_21055 [Leptospira santarosai serovar Shermani str. LT 821]